MKKLLGINPKVVLSGVSGIFSVLSFILMNGAHLITAYSTWIIIVCFVALAACFFNKRSKGTLFVGVFACVLLAMSLLARWDVFRERRRVENRQLECEGTFILADALYDLYAHEKSIGWLYEAIDKDELTYLLVPRRCKLNNYLKSICKPGAITLAEEGGLKGWYCPDIYVTGNDLTGGYYPLAVLNVALRDGFAPKRQRLMPESTSLVLKARIIESLINQNMGNEKELFEKADALGNPAASYYLSFFYKQGRGMESNAQLARKYMERSAKFGTKRAQYIIGSQIIADSLSSATERAKAIDYLKDASVFQECCSKQTLDASVSSVLLLETYYHSIRRYDLAYEMTKKAIEKTKNPKMKYVHHLDNCLLTKRYKEAMEIIRQGERNNIAGCYLTHAEMLVKGQGYKRDLEKAKRFLKKYGEETGNPYYYSVMADILEQEGADSNTVEQLRDLYEVGYNKNVE